VIREYREIHLTSWPSDETASLSNIPNAPRLSSIVNRLHGLFSSHSSNARLNHTREQGLSAYIQTHLLHLGSAGAIDPHVDNVDASGSMIMGVSLGPPRIMRMTRRTRNDGRSCTKDIHAVDAFEVLLLPGSVYIQRHTALSPVARPVDFGSRYQFIFIGMKFAMNMTTP